jgi:hypothetical protein
MRYSYPLFKQFLEGGFSEVRAAPGLLTPLLRPEPGPLSLNT